MDIQKGIYHLGHLFSDTYDSQLFFLPKIIAAIRRVLRSIFFIHGTETSSNYEYHETYKTTLENNLNFHERLMKFGYVIPEMLENMSLGLLVHQRQKHTNTRI